MEKQGQTQDKQTQNRAKPAEPAGAQLAAEPGLATLTGFDLALASGEGRPQNQADSLADRRLLPVQRAALASRIGRRHGNRHLQLLLSEMGQPYGVEHLDRSGDSIQAKEQDEAQDEPTPEQKAAARAAARLAEAQAGQSAQQARQATSQSKIAGNKEKQAGKTAKQKTSQARSEAKAAKARRGKKKRGPAGKKGASPPASTGPSAAAASPAAAGLDQAPTSPEADPAFQQVVGKVKKAARRERKHEPAGKKAKQAQDAVPVPAKEIEGRAQTNQTGVMEAAPAAGFDKAAFKAALMARIAAIAPKTTAEADSFKGSGKLSSVKSEMAARAGQETAAARQPMQTAATQAPNTGAVPVRPAKELAGPAPGPGATIPGAAGAAPKPKTTAEVEKPIQENTRTLDDQMQAAEVTEDQLAESNEPEFQGALDAKKEAKAQAETGPQAFRQAEQGTLDQAQAGAEGLAQQRAQGMHADRASLFGQVAGRQGAAKSKDEQERQRIGAEINTIYEQTKSKVESILSALDGRVNATFEQGAAEARQAFEDYVDARVEAYKEDRYGGWFGWARWAKDKLLGMPAKVNTIYQQGRQLFINKMDAVINNVVEIIAAGLSEAKAEIANGKKRIQEFLAGLPDNLQEVGQQAAQEIQSKFDSLESSVDSKQSELIDNLAKKYNETLSAVDARIEELKAANQGLVQKALNAVVGAIKIILKLKDMLLSVLAKVAGVVGKIIRHPIRFLGNLISGVSQGFKNFASRIKEHLVAGLVGWLTGALGPLGIQIPDDIFSLEGIFSLIVQVLGLSWEFIRAKAVKLLGEPVVQALEKGFEIFQVLAEKGPMGLWEYLKDQFSDLKETVIGAIEDLIKSEVVEAGIEWIMGLLTPAGAFIKAAKAIYKIVMFFVEKGSQVMELVNSVIDGIGAIADGAVSGAARLIENALARALPLVIGFLASLLGLDDLAEKVQGVIKKIRGRIEAAIDGLILKAKQFVGKGMQKLGFGKDKAPVDETKPEIGHVKNIQVDQPFTMYHTGHHLYVNSDGPKLVIEMASQRRATLESLATRALIAEENGAKRSDVIGYLEKAREELKELEFTWAAGKYYMEEPGKNGKEGEDGQSVVIKKCEQIAAFLTSLGKDYKIEDLENMGHPSIYVEGNLLKPEHATAIREKFYPSGYNANTKNWKKARLIALTNPNNPSEFKDEMTGKWEPKYKPDGSTNATIDHYPMMVVDHWNNRGGNNTRQGKRADDYNKIDNMRIVAWKNNSSDGAEARNAGLLYKPDVGPDFRGPDDKD